jgi:hypothetical protein
MLVRNPIFSILVRLTLLGAMLLLLAPKELWHKHNHNHKHNPSEQVPAEEEDCAICDYHFSAYHFESANFNLSVPSFRPLVVSLALTFTPASKILAHSGLSPPSA